MARYAQRFRLCAGSRDARWDIQVALAPSVPAQLMISQRSSGLPRLSCGRAVPCGDNHTRPQITGRRVDVFKLGGLRPPAWTYASRVLASLSMARSEGPGSGSIIAARERACRACQPGAWGGDRHPRAVAIRGLGPPPDGTRMDRMGGGFQVVQRSVPVRSETGRVITVSPGVK